MATDQNGDHIMTAGEIVTAIGWALIGAALGGLGWFWSGC